MPTGSSPVSGSSKTSVVADRISPHATTTCCRMPRASSPGGGPQNSGNRPQGRRLAGAVGSNQADDLAAADLQRQVVDGGEGRAAGNGIVSGEVLDGEGHRVLCYD